MITKIVRSSVLGLLVLFMSFYFIISAKAADTGAAGLIISPPLTEKEVKPGNTFSGKIKITNPNANAALNVTVSLSDFKANGEGGEQTFVEPEQSTTFGLATWLDIIKSFELAPNESKEIPYTINAPANAEPGGHYGVLFFSPTIVDSEALGGSGITAIPKVGALLLVTVPGNIKYDGNIKEFLINKNFFGNSANTVDFTTRFENLSSNHVKPQGNIVIRNVFGKEVANLIVNEKVGNVLPNSIRKFDNTWDKKYGFGLYKATLSLAYGDSSSATSELSFWIIPWKETAGAVVILILLIWVISHLKWGGKGKNEL